MLTWQVINVTFFSFGRIESFPAKKNQINDRIDANHEKCVSTKVQTNISAGLPAKRPLGGNGLTSMCKRLLVLEIIKMRQIADLEK